MMQDSAGQGVDRSYPGTPTASITRPEYVVPDTAVMHGLWSGFTGSRAGSTFHGPAPAG